METRMKYNERLSKLKSGPSISGPAEEEKSHGAKDLLDPALCKAIRGKDVELFLSTLEKLCSEGLRIDEIMGKTTRSGNTALHLATDAGSTLIVELIAVHFPYLLERPSSIEQETVLHVAARTGNSNLIQTILGSQNGRQHPSSSVRVERLCIKRDAYRNTALHHAVKATDIATVSSLFLASKEAVRCHNKEGKTPLYLAVESRELNIILLLLRDPIHGSVEWDSEIMPPLHAAILGDNNSVRDPFRIYEAIGGFCVPQNRPSDAREIKKSNAALVDVLLRESSDLLRSRDSIGRSPLHWAASTGDVKCVEILLEKDHVVTLEWNEEGYLPVHVACELDHVKVVKKIVEQDWLDPKDLRTEKGQNILHIAAKCGNDKVVSYILSRRQLQQIFINERDKDGNTPLHLAHRNRHPNVLFLLTQETTLDYNLSNHEGLPAREIKWQREGISPPTLRELLASYILTSSDPTDRKGVEQFRKRPIVRPTDLDKWYKDQMNTLMLVAILVATVTFAAGFTVPGGLNGSNDPERGMSTLINRSMFQLYVICNAVAMYSSAFASFIMLWAQSRDDYYVTLRTWTIALFSVGVALITMSIAFMAAVHLVVSPLSWLAIAVLIFATMFLSVFLAGFTLLAFPLKTINPLLRPFQRLVFRILIPFARSYSEAIEEKDEESEDQEEEEGAEINIRKDREGRKC